MMMAQTVRRNGRHWFRRVVEDSLKEREERHRTVAT